MAKEMAKMTADGMCLYCRWVNHMVAARMWNSIARTFKAAAGESREIGTRDGYKKLGNDSVKETKMARWQMEKVLI